MERSRSIGGLGKKPNPRHGFLPRKRTVLHDVRSGFKGYAGKIDIVFDITSIYNTLMRSARLVAFARRSAGHSQRELAERSGIPQPAIARIEAGRTTPRADTLERLLRACGVELNLAPLAGEGVDRTAIRSLLALTPAERTRVAVEEARNLDKALGRGGR